jgi:hypothetical protein
MRSVVVDPVFDWGDDRPPRIAYPDSVIYEVHVRGLAGVIRRYHPNLQGTYAGLAHPAIIGYLQRLGVTAVELTPVHQFVRVGAPCEKSAAECSRQPRCHAPGGGQTRGVPETVVVVLGEVGPLEQRVILPGGQGGRPQKH